MASTISAPLEAESLATATVLTGLEREQSFGGIATENRQAAIQDTSQIISEVKSKFKSRLAFVRQKHPDKPLAEFAQQLFGLSGSAPPPPAVYKFCKPYQDGRKGQTGRHDSDGSC